MGWRCGNRKRVRGKERGMGVVSIAQPYSSDPLEENEADRSECALKMFPF